MMQTIIVVAIVVIAAAWAIRIIIKRARSGGCAACDSCGSCPFANTGASPPEQVDQATEEEEANDGQ